MAFCICPYQPRCRYDCRKIERRNQVIACSIIMGALIVMMFAMIHYFEQ